MKKSQISILLILTMLISIFSITVATAEASDIYLFVGSEVCQVGDKEITIDKQNAITPYIKNSRTMVPIRFLSENLGYIVSFNDETKTAFLEKENTKISITTGESIIVINGEKKQIDSPSEIKNSRLFVPLRAISESTGKNVDYKKGLVSVKESENKITDEDYNNIVAKISPAKKIASEKEAKELLEKYGGQNYYGRMYALSDAKASTPNLAGSAESTKEKFSTTNVQVDGVDESDIIKTDGTNIYTIVSNTVKIIKPDPLEVLATINKDNNFFNPQELYIDNNRLVVIGFEYEEVKIDDKVYPATQAKPAVDSKMAIMPYIRQNNYTKVMIYDVSNPTAPVLVRETKVEGDNVSTRKIGNNLYFITNKWVYSGGVGIMPMVRENGLDKVMPITNLSYFPHFSQNNIITVASVNIVETEKSVKTESFLGGGENVYVSNNNLYIAVTNYQNADDKGEYTQTTKIYRFALSDGEIFLNGTGEVSGTVLNQFSMDEYDSHFRIATSIQKWTEKENIMKNQLFVLDETMNISGSIQDIAPGERIYSTRFLGEKGYMVTFRNVDPFFAIDLSDHTNPKIMGALKIPGFSDYLHPYDENTIIGFGKDTAVVKNKWNNEDMAIALGFKLSAFDVTDFANPVESFKEVIGDRGTNSEISYNHKVLLVDKETGLLAFPIDVYEAKDKTNIEEYGKFAYQGLFLFKFSKETGFQEIGKITHLTDNDILKAGNYGFDYQNRISRAVYIGEKLYTLSENKMASHNINTLEKISQVNFK
jgi:uncharacterized secreted protein with C-terminal beta-propeller domain